MRIAHFIQTLDPDMGGPVTVAASMAGQLALQGHEVTLVYQQRPEARQRIANLLKSTAGCDRLQILACDVRSNLAMMFGRDLCRRLSASIEDFDVIHMHGIWEPALMSVASMARRAAVPYINRPAGMLMSVCVGQKSWKKKLALRLGVRRMLEQAAAVHYLKPYERDESQWLNLPTPEIVIPGGVNESIMQQPLPDEPFTQSLTELDGREYFVFLGRLHPIKGLDFLVESFAQYVQLGGALDLVLLGPDGGMREPLQQQVRNLSLNGRVHMPGAVYGQDKLRALRDARAYVQSSRLESFGMSIVEAASQCPVIITESCHFPDIERYEAGRVVPNEAGAFARAMLELDHDADRSQRLRNNARTMVAEHYTWPRIAEKMTEAYQQIIDRKQS